MYRIFLLADGQLRIRFVHRMKNWIIALAGMVYASGLLAQEEQHDCSHHRVAFAEAALAAPEGVPEELDYDAGFVHLDLNLTNQNNSVSGVMTMRATAEVSLSQCALELHSNLLVDSAYFNGVKRTFTHNSGILKILAPAAVAPGNEFTVSVYYHGNPPNGGFFNGFSNATSPTWGNAVTWSLSEPNNAHQWWPCKQVLTDKFDSSKVWITVDSNLKAGSNGVLEKITTLGVKKRFEWNYPHPIAYYLISVAVASYTEYNFNVNIPGIAKPVFVQNFIYDNPSTLTTFKTEIDKTGDMLKVFSDLFGPYPFADMKYGHCMAPFSGGMEHNTMTTQGTFNTTLTAHELAHQWWGDHVTCKSWKDIWVNEGFARYCEYLYYQSYSAGLARGKIDDLNRSSLSQPGGMVYVTDTINPGAIFNGRLTYDKGAVVIHMIRFELNNDSLFFKILKKYQKEYSNKNAGVQEFKMILEDESGIDFTTFFDQWYYGQGHPTFDVFYNNDSGHCILKVKQFVSFPSATARFITPLELRLKRGVGDTLVRVQITGDSNVFQIPLNGTVTGIEVDPNQWVLNDTGGVLSDTSLQYYFNAVRNYNTKNITVYPNPVKEYLHISGMVKPEYFYISDMEGRVVKEGIAGTDMQISVNKLPSGVYHLRTAGRICRFVKIND